MLVTRAVGFLALCCVVGLVHGQDAAQAQETGFESLFNGASLEHGRGYGQGDLVWYRQIRIKSLDNDASSR